MRSEALNFFPILDIHHIVLHPSTCPLKRIRTFIQTDYYHLDKRYIV